MSYSTPWQRKLTILNTVLDFTPRGPRPRQFCGKGVWLISHEARLAILSALFLVSRSQTLAGRSLATRDYSFSWTPTLVSTSTSPKLRDKIRNGKPDTLLIEPMKLTETPKVGSAGLSL